MWPRMLFELLPHFARLVPMADKFFASRSATDTGQEAALAAMAESMRSNLGQVAETHAGIQRALKEQSVQTAEIAVQVTLARMGVESIEARIASAESRLVGLENTASVAMKLLAAGMVLLVGVVALLGLVLLHLSRH